MYVYPSHENTLLRSSLLSVFSIAQTRQECNKAVIEFTKKLKFQYCLNFRAVSSVFASFAARFYYYFPLIMVIIGFDVFSHKLPAKSNICKNIHIICIFRTIQASLAHLLWHSYSVISSCFHIY